MQKQSADKSPNRKPSRLPIAYRPEYNVGFCGLEKLHPFDASKWGTIFKLLTKHGFLSDKADDDNNDDGQAVGLVCVYAPDEVDKTQLLRVHSRKYLKSLKNSFKVAKIAEVLPMCLVPNCLLQSAYLRPMRFQVGGSILCGFLALEHGWSINLGGGFHHCSANKGGGFCPYADITLLIRSVLDKRADVVKRVLIVDLDAHQGNGYARDFKDDANVYVLDMYNASIYPRDEMAKKYINFCVELKCFTGDELYLKLIEAHLQSAVETVRPDLMVYNAGVDILQHDPLGMLSITPAGVVERDRMVFACAKLHKVPIVMLLSGGYTRGSGAIVATSIINLRKCSLLD